MGKIDLTGLNMTPQNMPPQHQTNMSTNFQTKSVVCLHREEEQERLAVLLLNKAVRVICVVGSQGSGRHTLIDSMPDYFKACNLQYDFSKVIEAYDATTMMQVLQSGLNPDNVLITSAHVLSKKGLYEEIKAVKIVILANESDLKNLSDNMSAQINYVAVPDLKFEETVDVIKNKYPQGIVNINTVTPMDFGSAGAQLMNQVYNLSKTMTVGNPYASVQLLEEACYLKYKRMVEVNPTMATTGGPISDNNVSEAYAQLLNLATSNTAHDAQKFMDATAYIKGQDNVKDEVNRALFKRQLLEQKKPLTMLFVGSSGNGKTELSKALANYLGAKFIRLNMAEYRMNDSLNKITGSSYGFVGSDTSNTLPLEPIITNPVSVVLLDEFEKACIEVKQFFMNAFDEGYVQMAKGTIINCKSCIFIATSNAGFTTGQHKAGFNTNATATAVNGGSNDFLDEASIVKNFSLELWNRFSNKIKFNDLTEDAVREILADKWATEAQYVIDKGYTNVPNVIPDDVLDKGIEEYLKNKSEGARFVNRFVEDAIVDVAI